MNRFEQPLDLAVADDYSPEHQRQIWNDTERLYPELWRQCYPKIYSDYKPGEYYSPKSVARQIFGSIMKIKIGAIGESEKLECFWASFMARRRNPTYWVTRDVVEAVMRTTPPMQLDWYNMNLPYNAMAFMLPKGSLSHEEDGDVEFISFMRARRLDWVDNVTGLGPKQLASENGSFVLFAKNLKYFIHWNMPHEHFPVVDLRQIEEALTRFEDVSHTSGWWLSTATMNKADTRLGIKAAHLLFGLLLLMTRKPEIVTPEILENRVKCRRGTPPKEFWTPAVIGKHYAIKRVPRITGQTHASPRYHWVKGFWKEHHYGPKSGLTKEIWIEPYERGQDGD